MTEPSRNRHHRWVDWETLLDSAMISKGEGLTELFMEAPSLVDLSFLFTFPINDPRDRARHILPFLWELDDQAFAYLTALERWPYGDDVVLWKVIEDETSLRLCYMQSQVNDEQVVGFAKTGDGWQFQGMDPRFWV